PSQEGKVKCFSLVVEEGWRAATGWRGFDVGPPVRDIVASCPPSQEGKGKCFPLRVEEAWRVATGWWGLTPQDHPSATVPRPALLHGRAEANALRSSASRGGGESRGEGGWRRAR